MESTPEGALEQGATDSTSTGQVQPSIYTRLALKPANSFTFLKVVKKKKKDTWAETVCRQQNLKYLLLVLKKKCADP